VEYTEPSPAQPAKQLTREPLGVHKIENRIAKLNNPIISKHSESAIIVPVPEVEQLVSDIRKRYDPSALVGVPAHITINYPFKPYLNNPKEVSQDLIKIISSYSQFTFKLMEICTFTRTVYLSPQPVDPFLSIIKAITNQFPDSQPYEGEFPQPIPHLTLAQINEDELFKIKEEIINQIGSFLPIAARASELWLIDNSEEIWKRRNVFHLIS
jgi:2'-5' RNA ligase